jgi:hypothetical protein
MSGRFSLENYDTVESRIAKFWGDHPQGRIHTDLMFRDDRQYIVKAEVYTDREDDRPAATGWAEEIIGSSPVNKTAALENAETSAVGRALANLNYATKARPSQTEMGKAARQEPPKEVGPYREKALAEDVTVEELRRLHAMARQVGLLDAKTLDGDGTPTTLGELITARGQALAPKVAA